MKTTLPLAASLILASSLPLPCAADAGPPPSGVALCAACHGGQGEGNAGGVPRLAGQSAAYLQSALQAFRAGTRTSAVMQPIASSLAVDDVQALAAYFAGLHGVPEAAAAPPDPRLVAAGATLALVGAAEDPTPACFSCHGAQGRGDNGRFPSLAGQPASYIVDRLHAFQARARAKLPEPATMTAVAARLSEAQVRQAAAYLSTLPAP